MADHRTDAFSEEQEEVLRSIRVSRIILPILLGVGVVGYLFWKQFNLEDFQKIDWTLHTAIWIGVSLFLLIIRHLAYANRLRILSKNQFDWRKSIELIFIWEFSSAVSPTSIGGSAVALVVLAQEKLSAARTTSIVVYTAVQDTLFFVGTLPLLLWFFGPQIIRPGMSTIRDLDGWGFTFLGAYFFMAAYGFLFFYGLFIKPKAIKRLLLFFTRIKLLRRFRHKALNLGNDLIVTSKAMRQESWPYHLGSFFMTATAWSCRFLLLNCLIIAFVPSTSLQFYDQISLYARLETMFVVMAFSPTPGGAGFAEIAFWGFLNDYVPTKSLALIIAGIWRLFTYYFYLFIGVLIIPNWIRKIINLRKNSKKKRTPSD